MCKVYGYCRISRKEQSIDRQVRNILAEYPEAHILKEAFTGIKVEGRREFEKLLKIVHMGDNPSRFRDYFIKQKKILPTRGYHLQHRSTLPEHIPLEQSIPPPFFTGRGIRSFIFIQG